MDINGMKKYSPTGYSQGGHACSPSQKASKEYSDEFPVKNFTYVGL